MNNEENIKKVIDKYKFQHPISDGDQKRIEKSKKEVLRNIIKTEEKDSLGLSFVVSMYYGIKKYIDSFTLAASYRVFYAVSAMAVLIILSGAVFSIRNYIFAPVQGTVIFAQGDARIVHSGKKDIRIARNQKIKANDIIQTGEESQITFQTGSIMLVKIQSGSLMEIESIPGPGDGLMKLNKGSVLIKAKPLIKNMKISIETPNAIAVIKGTEFKVSYGNKKTTVAVKEGKVNVELKNVTTKKILDSKIIEKNTTAVITDTIQIRQSGEIEDLEISKIKAMPFISKDVEDDESELNRIINKQLKHEKEIDEKIRKIEQGRSNNIERKNKYTSIFKYEIILKNGKRYTGIISSRSEEFITVLTSSGDIKIPQNDIKSTRIIK